MSDEKSGKINNEEEVTKILEVQSKRPSGGRQTKLWLFLIVQLIVIFIIFCLFYYNYKITISIEDKIRSLRNDVEATQRALSVLNLSIEQIENPEIDLTIKSFQPISDGFSISITSVDSHLTGVKVKGKVLNQQSTAVTDTEFSIEIGNTSQNFEIKRINSGYAANFDVYIPDVNISFTKNAIISWLSSKVQYSFQD